jgi:phosphate:Na+ symporter
MTFGFDNFAELAGGLALFLYGIHRARSGLERASGGGLRAALALLTRRPIAAALVGVGLTLVTQSSSAVAVILVGMVGSGLIGFGPSVAVLLGADLATTLTV